MNIWSLSALTMCGFLLSLFSRSDFEFRYHSGQLHGTIMQDVIEVIRNFSSVQNCWACILPLYRVRQRTKKYQGQCEDSTMFYHRPHIPSWTLVIVGWKWNNKKSLFEIHSVNTSRQLPVKTVKTSCYAVLRTMVDWYCGKLNNACLLFFLAVFFVSSLVSLFCSVLFLFWRFLCFFCCCISYHFFRFFPLVSLFDLNRFYTHYVLTFLSVTKSGQAPTPDWALLFHLFFFHLNKE